MTCSWKSFPIGVFVTEDQRKPLVLVAGMIPAVAQVAERFLVADPNVALVHYDLRRSSEEVVIRRLQHRNSDHSVAVELTHACVSCTLREDLLPLLQRLAGQDNISRIVLHLDPSLEPEPVCWALQHVVLEPGGQTLTDVVRIDAVLTVLDERTWLDDATSDLDLTERGLGVGRDDDRTLAQVAVNQVEFADALVLVGKNSAAQKQYIENQDIWTQARTMAVLDRIAPTAPRITLADCDLAADFEPARTLQLIRKNARRGRITSPYEPLLRGEPPLQSDCGVSILVFIQRRPFHPQRLHDAMDVLLDGVVRAKGRIWVASQPDSILWLESAGGGLRIGHTGTWLAAMTPDEQAETDPERQAVAALTWDPYYGDRSQELVIVTHMANPNEINSALTEALLTDSELSDGQDMWRQYPDPFGSWHTDPCDDLELTDDTLSALRKDES